jgi:hypothetical protein
MRNAINHIHPLNLLPKRQCLFAKKSAEITDISTSPEAVDELVVALEMLEKNPDLNQRMESLKELYAEMEEGIRERVQATMEAERERGKYTEKLKAELESHLGQYTAELDTGPDASRRVWLADRVQQTRSRIHDITNMLEDSSIDEDESEQIQQQALLENTSLLQVVHAAARVLVQQAIEKSEAAGKPLDQQQPWEDIFQPLLVEHPEFANNPAFETYVHNEIYRQYATAQVEKETAFIAANLDTLNQTPEETALQMLSLFLEANITEQKLITWQNPEAMAEDLFNPFGKFISEHLGVQGQALKPSSKQHLAQMLHQLLQSVSGVLTDEKMETAESTIVQYRNNPDVPTRETYAAALKLRTGKLLADTITNVHTMRIMADPENAAATVADLRNNPAISADDRSALGRIAKAAADLAASQSRTGHVPQGIGFGWAESILRTAPTAREMAASPMKYAGLGLGLLWGSGTLLLNSMKPLQNLYRLSLGGVVQNITLNPVKGFGIPAMIGHTLSNIGPELLGRGKPDGQHGFFGNIFRSKSVAMTATAAGVLFAATRPEQTATFFREAIGSRPVTSATELAREAGRGISSGASAMWNSEILRSFRQQISDLNQEYGVTEWFSHIPQEVAQSWEQLGVNIEDMKANHLQIAQLRESLNMQTSNLLPDAVARVNIFAESYTPGDPISKRQLTYMFGGYDFADTLHFEQGQDQFSIADKMEAYRGSGRESYLNGALDLGLRSSDVWQFDTGILPDYLNLSSETGEALTKDEMKGEMKDKMSRYTRRLNFENILWVNTNRDLYAARETAVAAMDIASQKRIIAAIRSPQFQEAQEVFPLPEFLADRTRVEDAELTAEQKAELINYSLQLDMAHYMLNGANPLPQKQEVLSPTQHASFYTQMNALSQQVKTQGDPSWYNGTFAEGALDATAGVSIDFFDF